jgi:predicted PurR-regulated permease PerM
VTEETPSGARIDGSSGEARGWTRRHVIFVSISAAVFVSIVFIAHEILLPFILALIIAYVLTPAVAAFERRRVPRSASILLVYAIVLGSLYFGIAAAAPRLYRETAGLFREGPTILKSASSTIGPKLDAWIDQTFPSGSTEEPETSKAPALEIRPQADGSYAVNVGTGIDVVQVDTRRMRIEPRKANGNGRVRVTEMLASANDHFFNYIKANGGQLLRVGQLIVSRTIKSIFLLFMTLMVAGYLMHTRERVIGFFRSMVPERSRTSFDWLMFRIDRGLSGVVRGQLMICVLNGIFAAIGFGMFHLKYWPVMALVAAIGSLIPIFGSIISAVPAVAIGLTQSFWTGLWVLLWILGVHQLEANFLNPKIIGTSARIHPVLVVFMLITGEHLFGAWGALLAVPTWSLLQSFFQHFRYLSIPDATDTLLPLPGKAPHIAERGPTKA